MIAYPRYPMGFLGRIKRVVRRFSSRGTSRDITWMHDFCQKYAIDYKIKMQVLQLHLTEEDGAA